VGVRVLFLVGIREVVRNYRLDMDFENVAKKWWCVFRMGLDYG
jgi:hypothetical protein